MNIREYQRLFSIRRKETSFSVRKHQIIFDVNDKQLSLPEHLGMESIWEWNKESKNSEPNGQTGNKNTI